MASKSATPTILLGDWKAERASGIRISLQDAFKVECVGAPRAVISFSQSQHPPVVILPLCWCTSEVTHPLEDCEGYHVIRALSALSTPPEIILFDGNVERFSLSEYCKPFLHRVAAFLDEDKASFNALLALKTRECAERFAEQHDHSSGDFFSSLGLVGQSDAMQDIRRFITNAAYLSDLPVMICGESGTGKELIAQAIHRLDEKRGQRPFLAVNCSAISGEIAESEFFGHRRGAFTGAMADRPGFFRAAEGGTLFLDEISELAPHLQPKLLRVIQEGKVLPVGEEHEEAIDVRLIAGSNKNLEREVAEGRFRLDLFHRINVLALEVPGLRFRKDDIESLFYAFLKKHQSCYRYPIQKIDEQVLALFHKCRFEGNIRELENLVRKTLFRKSFGENIEMADVPPEIIASVLGVSTTHRDDTLQTVLIEKIESGCSLKEVMFQSEKLLIKWAEQKTDGNRSKMARMLQTTTRNLFNKMR